MIFRGGPVKKNTLYMAMAEKTLKSDRGWIFPSLLGEGVGVFLIEFWGSEVSFAQCYDLHKIAQIV